MAENHEDANHFGEFLYWKDGYIEDFKEEEGTPDRHRRLLQQFSNIGPLPYTNSPSEYMPISQQFLHNMEHHQSHDDAFIVEHHRPHDAFIAEHHRSNDDALIAEHHRSNDDAPIAEHHRSNDDAFIMEHYRSHDDAFILGPHQSLNDIFIEEHTSDCYPIIVTSAPPVAACDLPDPDVEASHANIDPDPAQTPKNSPLRSSSSSSLQEPSHSNHLYSNQLLHPTPTSDQKHLKASGPSPFSLHRQLVTLLKRLESIRKREHSSSLREAEDDYSQQRHSLWNENAWRLKKNKLCCDDDNRTYDDGDKYVPYGRFFRKKGIRRKKKQVKMGNRGSQQAGNIGAGDVKDHTSSKNKHSKDELTKASTKTQNGSSKQKPQSFGQKDLRIKTEYRSDQNGISSQRSDASGRDRVSSSNSGDSIVSLTESLPNGNFSELRIDSTSSPDSSSISSSLYVDTQEKFMTSEDVGAEENQVTNGIEEPYIKRHRRSVSQVIEAIRQGQPPLLPTPEQEENLLPDFENANEKNSNINHVEHSESEEVDGRENEKDEDEGSFHDTQEDASSCDTDNSPQKEYSTKERKRMGTRSFPGTPSDAQMDGFGNFAAYKYGGSTTSIYGRRRASLSPIGSVDRLDLDNKLVEDEDELTDDPMFKSNISLVVPKFRSLSHQKLNLQSPCHRFRTPSPVAKCKRDLCNSELCLRSGPPNTVPQVLRRYCSQNIFASQPLDCCSSVLKRVASLTLDKATLEKKVKRPNYIPEKLDFSLYEKFEGQMLVNWFCSSFPEDHYLMNGQLSRQDLKILVAQFCTHLLVAGVLKQIEDDRIQHENLFRPDLMYYWSKLEAHTPVSNYVTPGKISPSAWPPPEPKLSNSNSYSEKDLHNLLQTLKNEHQSAIERIQVIF